MDSRVGARRRGPIIVGGPLAAFAAGLRRDLAGQGYALDTVGDHVHLLADLSYRCYRPRPVPLRTLVRVAGRRWTVEENSQAGKGLTGLDQHQVRRWTSWHRATIQTTKTPTQPNITNSGCTSREDGVVTCTCAGWIIANVSETVAKALTSREWFREPGGHCIYCRDPLSPGVAL